MEALFLLGGLGLDHALDDYVLGCHVQVFSNHDLWRTIARVENSIIRPNSFRSDIQNPSFSNLFLLRYMLNNLYLQLLTDHILLYLGSLNVSERLIFQDFVV